MGLFGSDKKDLWKAASNGDVKKIKEILSKGIPVDTPAENNTTALIMACGGGHLEAVRVLLDNGAKVNNKTTNGYTPLLSACYSASQTFNLSIRNFLEIVDLLLSKGADVDQITKNGNTALIQSVASDLVLVKSLIGSGADVNYCVPMTKITPLMSAALYGKKKTVQLLIKAGAEVDAKDRNEETALFYACSSTRRDYSNYLTSNLTQVEKDALILIAAKRGGVLTSFNIYPPDSFEKDIYDIAEILLDAGTNFKLKNTDGLKPIEIAFKAGNTKIVDLLTSRGASK